MKKRIGIIVIYIFLIIVVFLPSCSEKIKDPILSEFTEIVELKSINSKIKSSDLGEIVDLLVIDSILIINEMYNDYIFKIFNISTGKLIEKCIKRGKGPNEMIFPRIITHYKNDIFTTYSENRKKLIFISLKNLLEKKFFFKKVYFVENEMLEAFKVYPINDSLVISTGIFEKGRYCLYNLNSKSGLVKFTYPFDKLHKNENNVAKGLAFQSSISIKPDFKKFAVFCRKSGIIEIYRLTNNDFTRVYSKVYYLPKYMNLNNHAARFSKSNKLAFISQTSSDSYIYALFSGHSKEKQGSDYYNGKNILVYNWAGKPIVNFRLDRNIRDMTLALEKDKVEVFAYSINQVTGNPEIVIYRLPTH